MNGIGHWSFPQKAGMGVLAVVILAGILYSPTLSARWQYHYYQNQYQARQIAEAARVLPQFDDLSVPLHHIHYQELMKSAGKSGDLERQYMDLATQNPANALALALSSRAVSDPEVQQRLLNQALQLAPGEETVRLIQIESDLAAGQYQTALEQFQGIQTQTWYRAYLEARTRWMLGYTNQTLESFVQALQQADCPAQVNIQFAKFLCEQDLPSKRNRPEPFAGWNEVQFINEPEAYAYRVWLSGKSIAQAAQTLPPPVRHHPGALIILAQAAWKRNPVPESSDGKEGEAPAGASWFKNEEILAAQALMRQAGRFASGQPEWIVTRGLFALGEHQPDRARVYFATGLNSGARHFDTGFHARMAQTLLAFNRLNEAVPHFEKAWGSIPENGLLLKQSGLMLLAEAKYDEALIRLKKASEYLPHDLETLNALVDAYIAKDLIDEALRTAARILDRNVHDPVSRRRLAHLWIKKDQINRAIGLYASYLDNFPNCGTCYAEIARIHIQNGDPARAERILRDALRDKPMLQDKEEIQAVLEEIEQMKEEKEQKK